MTALVCLHKRNIRQTKKHIFIGKKGQRKHSLMTTNYVWTQTASKQIFKYQMNN